MAGRPPSLSCATGQLDLIPLRLTDMRRSAPLSYLGRAGRGLSLLLFVPRSAWRSCRGCSSALLFRTSRSKWMLWRERSIGAAIMGGRL